MVKAITPQEARDQAGSHIPDYVIQAFNELIIENLVNKRASFTQDKAIDRIIAKNPILTRQKIFANGWLDVEPVFRRQGWDVEYDSPGYNESYAAHYNFKW